MKNINTDEKNCFSKYTNDTMDMNAFRFLDKILSLFDISKKKHSLNCTIMYKYLFVIIHSYPDLNLPFKDTEMGTFRVLISVEHNYSDAILTLKNDGIKTK